MPNKVDKSHHAAVAILNIRRMHEGMKQKA